MSISLGILTRGASQPAVRRLAREPGIRLIVEDVASGNALEATGLCKYERAADLVSGVPDIYDCEAREKTAVLLRDLANALHASKWCYAGVSLWDAVVLDLLWRHLDPLFQATSVARQLLAATKPTRVVIAGTESLLGRAIAAVASPHAVTLEVIERRTAVVPPALKARIWPYLGHLREWAKGLWLARRRELNLQAPFVVANHASRNFAVMVPVLDGLRQIVDATRILTVQIGSEGLKEVRQAGFLYERFECYASLTAGIRALRTIGPVVRFLTSGAWKDHVARAGVRWDGLPLAILAEPEISFALARLLGNVTRELVCAQTMLTREAPGLVFLTDERAGFGRAIGLAARSAGIPSIMVQWGPIASSAMWVPGVVADVAVVEGDVAAEVIRACDNAPDLHVVVTGQPRYDWLCREAAKANKPEICAKYGLDPDRPIVLYAPSAASERSARMRSNGVEEAKSLAEVEAVCRAVKNMAGVQLVVKPHPNEGTVFIGRIVERYAGPDTRLVSPGEALHPLLFACDIVVTRASTVGLDGVVLGKPVVVVNLTGRPDSLLYVQSGAALGAYNTSDVQPALHAALYDAQVRQRLAEKRPTLLRQYGGLQEGTSATDRIVALALELTSRDQDSRLGRVSK